MSGWLSWVPNGDLARNPGMCPDWESNQQPLASQASTQCIEPHQPGLKSKFFNVTCAIIYPPSECYLPFYTLHASYATLPIVSQTCHTLSHFVPLPIIFPLPQMPLLLSLLLLVLLYSAQILSTVQPLQAFSPSLHFPSWWSTEAVSVATSHLSVPSILHPAARVIFLKCKSDHSSFLLTILSPAASLQHRVQTQHPVTDSPGPFPGPYTFIHGALPA